MLTRRPPRITQTFELNRGKRETRFPQMTSGSRHYAASTVYRFLAATGTSTSWRVFAEWDGESRQATRSPAPPLSLAGRAGADSPQVVERVNSRSVSVAPV